MLCFSLDVGKVQGRDGEEVKHDEEDAPPPNSEVHT